MDSFQHLEADKNIHLNCCMVSTIAVNYLMCSTDMRAKGVCGVIEISNQS